MKDLNRFKELYCVIFGHEFNEQKWEKETDGFILSHTKTCSNCGVSIIDESGYLQKAKEKYGVLA